MGRLGHPTFSQSRSNSYASTVPPFRYTIRATVPSPLSVWIRTTSSSMSIEVVVVGPEEAGPEEAPEEAERSSVTTEEGADGAAEAESEEEGGFLSFLLMVSWWGRGGWVEEWFRDELWGWREMDSCEGGWSSERCIKLPRASTDRPEKFQINVFVHYKLLAQIV